MKRKILKKIRTKMIVLQVIWLLLLFGITGAVFILFADDYYYHRKLNTMENAFEYLKNTDISRIDHSDLRIMRREEQGVKFIIADENFNCVYTSNTSKTAEKTQAQIERKIISKVRHYKTEFKKRNHKFMIKGYGMIIQDEHTYYVYIYERKLNSKIHFSYYQLFFGIISLLALVVGVAVSYLIADRISKPIRRIEKVAGNAVENDFDVKIDENQEFAELSGLARSINIMMAQIRNQMKELEQELEHKSMVEEKRRNFVNNVSHELKTPLAIISSQVEMLQLIDDDEKRKEYCSSIMEETKNMANLINDMMFIYSAQNEEAKIELEEENIGNLVKETCTKYKDLFLNENIILHQEYDEDCFARINKRYFEQAFDNYITNSVKHSDKNGNVYIRVISKKDFVRIEVENEGMPVPEENRDKIWDMFYRGDVVETLQGQKGSGLGLYIVKSIIALHGGKYGFDNLEKGVVFWIELPKSNC